MSFLHFHNIYWIKYLLNSGYPAKPSFCMCAGKRKVKDKLFLSPTQKLTKRDQILPILCGILPYGPLEISQGHTFTLKVQGEELAWTK